MRQKIFYWIDVPQKIIKIAKIGREAGLKVEPHKINSGKFLMCRVYPRLQNGKKSKWCHCKAYLMTFDLNFEYIL